MLHKQHENHRQIPSLDFVSRGIRTGLIQPVFLLFAALLFLNAIPKAQAQNTQNANPPIINLGDAVVTGFSGVTALRPRPNTKIEDYVIINTQAPALQVFDLSQMYGPDNARLVNAPRHHSVPALQIGQVFGVALDDGQPASGRPVAKDPISNIYATATSVYGLHLVETKQVGNQKVRERAKVGSPLVTWMDGQFGPGGGPGSIWRIDGRTGKVSLFANVTLNGAANSGPALGAITFDAKTRRLFVSDLQTGMIHAFDLEGREVAKFDHGTQGRNRQGLAPVAFNPAMRINITNPAFNAENPTSWGFANLKRRVWGLGVNGGRLYYAAAEGPDIWSVGLTANGRFANDARVEIEVLSRAGNPVSAITFGKDGTMYLSQRGQPLPAYDFKVMATPGTSEVLRYQRRRLPSGRVTWEPAPKEYAIGHSQQNRSSNGGIALGFGYDENGYIHYGRCQDTLWTTGEVLRQSDPPAPRLAAGGQAIVHGLQGNPVSAVKPVNAPPMKAYFVDYDGQFIDPSSRGHMGQVAIWSPCKPGAKPPKKPTGPAIRIAKSCSAAAFGIDLHCRITLTSIGTVAPKGNVGFTDIGTVLKGPSWASKNPLIISAEWDDPNMTCSDLPETTLNCSIPGAVMQPGQSRSVDVVVDLAEVVDTPDWRIRNCATLDGTKQTSCVTRGEEDSLVVFKFGPNQQPCIAGGPCDFEVSVFNPGKRTFDGELFLADNLTIGGGGVGGITVDAVFPQNGCDIRGLTLPLQWQCHVTIPPGGERIFNILLNIPKSAVPAGVTQGRNCFVATDPNLALGVNGLPNHFWNNILDPANTNFQLGRDCVDFDILPAGTIQPRPPGIPFGAKMQLSAKTKPGSFSAGGQDITYDYKVLNTGIVPITSFKITDDKATGIKCPPLTGGALAPGASVLCKGSYKTKAGDVGKDIVSTAKVTAKTANGNVPNPLSVKTRVKFSAETTVSLTVSPTPSTFSKAGEKITYRYIIRNTGAVPVTSTALKDSRVTKFTCRPSGGAVPVGGTTICTGTYATKPGDVGKDITSTASVTGKTASGIVKSPPPVNSVVKFIKPKVVAKPSISLVVKPSQASYKNAGERITYTYTVRNTGDVAVNAFTLTDNTATGLKCAPGNTGPNGGPLAPKASATCAGSYTTTASDVGIRDIESSASVTGAAGSAPVKTLSIKSRVKFAGKPGVTLTAFASPATFTRAGEQIATTYKVTNTGDVAFVKFSIGHVVHGPKANLDNKKCPPANADQNGGRIAPGASVTCTGLYTTKPSDINQDITFDVYVRGHINPKMFPAGNPKPVKIVVKYDKPKVVPKPAASVAVKPSLKTYSSAGQTINYIYTIKNTGNVPLITFKLLDFLSDAYGKQLTGVIVLECPPVKDPGKPASGGPLAPGASATCLGTYTTRPEDVGKDLVNHPVAKAQAARGPGFNAQGAGVVRFAKPKPAPKPSLSLAVKPSPDTFSAAGQSITYIYTIANTGNVPFKTFGLGDKLPGLTGLECPPGKSARGGPLAPGATATCLGTYTTKPGDLGRDIVTNPIAFAKPAKGRDVDAPPASAVVKFAGKPGMSLTHTCNPKTYTAAGQAITCSFTVTNSGTIPIRSCQITGSRINVGCPPGVIPPGASILVQGSYSTNAGDIGKNIVMDFKLDGITQ